MYQIGLNLISIILLLAYSGVSFIINLLWNIRKKNDETFISFYDEYAHLYRIGILPIIGSFFNVVDLMRKTKS